MVASGAAGLAANPQTQAGGKMSGSRCLLTLLLSLSAAAVAGAQSSVAEPAAQISTRAESGTIPITTGSETAKRLYLEAQKLGDELHVTEAYPKYGEAVAADTGFALGYYGRAISSPTAAAFFENLAKAVARVDRVTPAEKHLILGLQAGANSDPEGQRAHYAALVQDFPGDPRGHFLLGANYNAIPDYDRAIEHYTKAIELNPSFSGPYNSLGYAYRAAGKFPEAETTFKKYIELLPKEPNPYDSYAEFLMKMGRFDESIDNYRKALANDPNFTFSYIGIGNNQVLQGKPEEARKTFQKFYDLSTNDGLRRTALFWTAASYVHEWKPDQAIETIHRMSAIAEKSGDLAALSGDRVLEGNVLLETGGSAEAALAQFHEAVAVIERADVPEEVKEAARRNDLYQEALVAIREKDLATARSKAAEYKKQVDVQRVPFEIQQTHELAGRIALAEGKADVAVSELDQASHQDPRILWALSRAYDAKGDATQARSLAEQTANFNQLAFALGYVRDEARKASTGA
jgi:tetratricopeptide (TPR) repeat protein